MPEIEGEKSKGSTREDMERTKELKEDVTEKYRKFMKRSDSPKVKNFFLALIHVEESHHNLAEKNLN